MLALIDGDALVFSAGFAIKKPDPAHFAFNIVKKTIDRILDGTEATDYKVYLGSEEKTNFRYKIAEDYKANRKDHARPDYEKEIRNYLFEHHSAIEVKGIETDDALGIEQTLIKDSIICSNDKDLDMIPGWHFDLDFGKTRKRKDGTTYRLKSYKKKAKYFITDPGFLSLRKSKENGKFVLCGGGYLWFCAQMLLGDSTDNIPSVAKGYGPCKVYEILGDLGGSLWHPKEVKRDAVGRVYKEYVNILQKDLTIEQIQARLTNIAQLVWIKREHGGIIFPRSWLC